MLMESNTTAVVTMGLQRRCPRRIVRLDLGSKRSAAASSTSSLNGTASTTSITVADPIASRFTIHRGRCRQLLLNSRATRWPMRREWRYRIRSRCFTLLRARTWSRGRPQCCNACLAAVPHRFGATHVPDHTCWQWLVSLRRAAAACDGRIDCMQALPVDVVEAEVRARIGA